MDAGNKKKGVIPKTFGMMLILLSSLNLMLCWRGGLSPGVFYPIVLSIGISLFAFGTIRGNAKDIAG